jgi:hypothetical protein
MSTDTKQDAQQDAKRQAGGYVVTAPYATLRIRDNLGNEVLTGFYAGGVLPGDVNRDDLERHLRKGMVAEQGTDEAKRATPFGQPVQFDERGMPKDEATLAAERDAESRRAGSAGAPGGNASRDAWAAHAASLGAPQEETRPVEEGGLSRDELRARYGG